MAPATHSPGWDDQNVSLAESGADVDGINAQFYGKYPFPPRAFRLERPLDPDFQRIMLCQDLGDWQHRTLPPRPAIWVAGCGTNQAVITALTFPRATVTGSDVSAASIDVASRGARDLALANLDLRRESLNTVSYRDQFDYVICTGVIHHNADPAAALSRLAAGLKPGGVLELMVYGRFQRIASSAVQKAIRILAGGDSLPGDARELPIAQALVQGFEPPGRMGTFLSQLRGARPAELADTVLQPVEYSYTVASLDELARGCGLELLVPVVNAFDKIKDNVTWDLTLPTAPLQEAYLACDDIQRWQVANLLLGASSPLLWFYLRRAADDRRSERAICASFLATCFTRVVTRKQAYALDAEEHYQPVPGSITYPPRLEGPLRAVIDACDGRTPMRQILERHGLSTAFPAVNDTRVRLTTTAFPYLRAVAS